MKKRTDNNQKRRHIGLRAAAAALAALLLAVSACSGGKTAPNGVGSTTETAKPNIVQDDEWKAYYPSGSAGNVELTYSIPKDKADRYSINTVVFGAGLGAETERDPFIVSFILPNGWHVERSGSAPGGFTDVRGDDNPLKGTVYIVNSSGVCVGTIGFSAYYMDLDPITAYKQIYAGISYGDYCFSIEQSYHPFYNAEASNIAAITETCCAQPNVPVRFNPAVVSHDPERGVFVAAEFFADRIDPIQLLDFAESLRIY